MRVHMRRSLWSILTAIARVAPITVRTISHRVQEAWSSVEVFLATVTAVPATNEALQAIAAELLDLIEVD
jgi:hypothetical protein